MAPLYDLVMLLDSDAPSERREEILREVDTAIGGGGSVESQHHWGVRRLSYEIAHRAEADYHLIQFTGPPALLESLERTLRLADTVVRFRIIKVKPGTPPPPSGRASEGAGADRGVRSSEPAPADAERAEATPAAAAAQPEAADEPAATPQGTQAGQDADARQPTEPGATAQGAPAAG